MNVGIVGCGRVTGLRHLPALSGLDGASVVALADLDADRLERAAREVGVGRRYTSHVELLGDDLVEAVAVCVPAPAHAEVALAALDAGKHVLIEKPLCLDLDEADALRAAAASSSATVMVGFNMRRHRLVRRAREIVASGALGRLEAIRTAFTSNFDYRGVARPWRFRREEGGGALIEMGAHHLDLWRFLSGLEVLEVQASTRSSDDDDDTVLVSGVLAGGARASTLLSQRSTNVNELEVFGERGRLRVGCYRSDGLELQLGGSFGGDVRHRLRGLARAAAELPAFTRGVRNGSDYVRSYRAQWRHFLACAAEGRRAEPDVEDGARNVEVLHAALESAASGRTVEVGGAAVRA